MTLTSLVGSKYKNRERQKKKQTKTVCISIVKMNFYLVYFIYA